ncbi:MAG TPA: DegQ family serine endoprotease [Hyphomicrobiaceae bacterium]|nr:DegQ family serine endoprotease [Hyphomicrobiaceae bacterium]
MLIPVLARLRGRGLCLPACAFLLLGDPGPAHAQLLDQSRGVLSLAPVLEMATSAVVNISVAASVPGRQNPLLQDPYFRRFFGRQDSEAPRPRQVLAAGSGVIVDAERGYVVTNNHVVERADRINVTTRDGQQLTAKLLGRDEDTDLAVLQIDAKGLVALPLADSDTLRVGDIVLAIGNPFGLGQTVTSGIISALGRSGLNAENYESFIQTDAPINPGNSGGALINSRGELAGINTAIIAPGGGNIGIGFAVPSNIVRTVVGQLEKYGEVRRGRIGVSIQTVTPRLAEALGLADARGVAVTSVERNSPAERAGLKAGDIIVEANGRPVRTAAELRTIVGLREVGSQVELTWMRGSERMKASLPVEPRSQEHNSESAGQGVLPQLAGATFAAEKGRIIVSNVEQGSRAWQLGLRPGDVIAAANRKPVDSIEDLRRAAGTGDGALALDVRRGDMQLIIVIG